MNKDFDYLRDLVIGTVESVSPSEIKVLLETNAPQNTAINTGTPTLFPKINGFLLIPNEAGALVGIISWIGIEYSQYPKRKGFKDFDLVDLPFPRRKVALNPLGILKNTLNGYKLERGVYSYPSVGDVAIIPTTDQLRAIVENKEENTKVQIGISPLAANAPVYVNPDKLFGRHLAVLGNTGSGKSCSVSGLIRWSIEAAKREKDENGDINARFIILDPNGEYTNTFDDLSSKIRKFKVKISKESENEFKQLRVPVWIWNSYEWGSITKASGRTQGPLLRRALREVRSGAVDITVDEELTLRCYYSSCLIEVKNDLNRGAVTFKGKPGKNDFGKKLMSFSKDAENDSTTITKETLKAALVDLSSELKNIAKRRHKTFTDEKTGEEVEYYDDFEKKDLEDAIETLNKFLNVVGGLIIYKGPDEDSPVFFKGEALVDHLGRLVQEKNAQQYMDFFLMRIRTMLSDQRMASIIGTKDTENENYLVEWLENYIGKSNAENGEIVIVDLSLVPSEIIHIIITVIARVIFEALQRYKKINQELLPTVLVLEEAHTFIRKYAEGSDEVYPSKMCTQTFEKIAREGRKFGLGLVISSQRPSELSPTVLSQCNTFLLHRIVNDRDQELVRKLVPDNLGGLLKELPVLPTRKAVLLGWASPIPILVEVNELKKEQRPQSKDPDFWHVWIGKDSDGNLVERNVNWEEIAKDWQGEKSEIDTGSEKVNDEKE